MNASVYMNLRTGITRENTADAAYAYWQPSLSFGVGAELPWSFHVYVEPTVHSWDKFHLITTHNPFYILLDSGC